MNLSLSVLLFWLVPHSVCCGRTKFADQQETTEERFNETWDQHQTFLSSISHYQPRVLGSNCFSISSFFSFTLIAVNTVISVSSNINNNNNNNNNNNGRSRRDVPLGECQCEGGYQQVKDDGLLVQCLPEHLEIPENHAETIIDPQPDQEERPHAEIPDQNISENYEDSVTEEVTTSTTSTSSTTTTTITASSSTTSIETNAATTSITSTTIEDSITSTSNADSEQELFGIESCQEEFTNYGEIDLILDRPSGANIAIFYIR